MAFLDNSGDIILDAVLTDYGRAKLASGSAGGAFVTSFAFFDDEINYGLYDYTHPSGSAYYDLEIVQTPILEAFTNNASSGKYPLYAAGLSTNLFYLPVLKLNTQNEITYFGPTTAATSSTTYIQAGMPTVSGAMLVAVDSTTDASLATVSHLFYGGGGDKPLRIDIGIDNTSATSDVITAESLRTTTAIAYYDSRFLRLHRVSSVDSPTVFASPLSITNIDDDNIAASRIDTDTTDESGGIFIRPEATVLNTSTATTPIASQTNFDAAILLKLDLTVDIKTSDYYFDLLGFTDTTTVSGKTFKVILTNIQVISQDTGASINVPVRICKDVTP